MSVNRSVLEKKTDKELEQYIKPDSRFVPEAVEHAFEILKSRGKEFTEEENQRIDLLRAEKNKKEEINISPNYIRASNIIYISAALGIINILLINNYVAIDSIYIIFPAICSITFVFGLGYLARIGTNWVKYILLINCALTPVLSYIRILIFLTNINPLLGCIIIIQTVLQIWALILLFKISQTKKLN
ncbi:hypothetical protein [Elizabethkingia ursingii]|uniref:Uncharacterized protein n=1 Tax=Elizabethkingia ursingii TaxID=1756150 RepID=A0ABX3N535_9FLAO|nr:hypothetical protein [Elizabethkingia ursingii]OPB86019.1 hypothetical protein BB021_13295 [Elizabethkingia ursingii]